MDEIIVEKLCSRYKCSTEIEIKGIGIEGQEEIKLEFKHELQLVK